MANIFSKPENLFPHQFETMANTMVEVKIFSGTNSIYLSEKIADYYGQPLGDISVNRFSDGEMQPVITESAPTARKPGCSGPGCRP